MTPSPYYLAATATMKRRRKRARANGYHGPLTRNELAARYDR